jgi:hypothetical protein
MATTGRGQGYNILQVSRKKTTWSQHRDGRVTAGFQQGFSRLKKSYSRVTA